MNKTFVSIYIPHPSIHIITELNSLLSFFSGPLIILGDFNIHHTMWGSFNCDSLSPHLIETFDSLNLCVLNDGSPTRRVSPLQNPSAVDLSLCSPQLASHLIWKILSSTYGSDHFPILITIPQESIPPKPVTPLLKYRTSQADWEKFQSEIDMKLNLLPLISDSSFLSCYDQFVVAIKSAADVAIPLKNSSTNKLPSPHWWDSDCTESVRTRKEAERRFSLDLSYDNYLDFQKSSAYTKRLLRKKKKIGWIRFCESLSPRTPSSMVWRKIKSFRLSFENPNIVSHDPSSWLNEFMDRLAPPYVPSEESVTLSEHLNDPSDGMNASFSFSELECVLSNLRDSSPGLDGIPYSFIINSSNNSKLYFLSIINKIFESGRIPDAWKTQVIIPILKLGKDPSDSSAYRPIALSSCLAKIAEHLVKNRLEWIVEQRNIISKSQFGFRKSMGTIDSLSIFTTDIRLSLSKGEHLVGVFLDIASAYDNVQLPILRQKLHNLSIPVRLTNFICNLFMDRFIAVRYQGNFQPFRKIWKGLPQGSVLSPILYNLYTYDLSESVNSFCNILQYADDVALYTSSCSFSEITFRLNSAITYLNDWLTNHGLTLSIPKCSVVVFTRKRIIPNIQISLNGLKIPVQNSVKFLGVILDSKLSGVHHLNYISEKCERNVNVLRSLSGVWWGSQPYSQKLLYNAIIRSHFDYGAFLLEPCNKMAIRKLDKIQSKCLRIITGAMRSSPINALQVECLDPPLFLRRQFLADRFFYNIVQYSNHDLIPKLHNLSLIVPHCDYWAHKNLPCLLKSYVNFSRLDRPLVKFPHNPIFSVPFEALILKPKAILNLGVTKNLPAADRVFNSILKTDWQDWLHIYTDASKMEGSVSVGAAVWIPRYRITLCFSCPSTWTIFSGEAIALLEAIKFVGSHKVPKTIIFSDSYSCLQDLLKIPFRTRDNFIITLKIREQLLKSLTLGLDIRFAWIPSHCGIAGNEVVDSQARDAINLGLGTYNESFARDLRIETKSHLKEKWTEFWKSSSSLIGHRYFNIQQTIPAKPWFFKYREFPKHATSTVIRLRLGHISSPVFLNKIRVRDHSLCECGLEEGTVDHIFFKCPNLSYSLYDCLPSNISKPVNMSFLLSLVDSPFIYELIKYILINNIKL
ncbi:hypothetical protein O3G_MSEX011460 [Manduca sexta]|uniref:RNA-directed DNA polymerase from mobile element jockey n=1 Tax=Manduca sexta TaxID=7130 RepID=A0A921ZKA6_MANSE|nr:hypothetical protein O3G_MSEX011460 [Manduca sexta]